MEEHGQTGVSGEKRVGSQQLASREAALLSLGLSLFVEEYLSQTRVSQWRNFTASVYTMVPPH